MFDEITASSLVKVDQQCNKLSESPLPVNPAGFVIHSAIHAVREDAGCVLHTHSRAGVAVSAQKCGVLPISQQSTFVLSSLAFHDYEGVALRDEEKSRLQADLGTASFLMLRNHGLVTVGRSVPDAFLNMYVFENTCRIQIDAQAGGELIEIDPSILQGLAQVMKTATSGLGSGVAWPALLRKLERMDPGYKTLRQEPDVFAANGGATMTDQTYKGGCTCGAVQLEIVGDPAVQAYCHCSSCRGWLGAPIHAAALWPATSVKVVKGADNLGLYKKTESSHRQFCRSCGSPVLVGHPGMGMTDVPAGNVVGLSYKPTVHVHYGEKVMTVRDGLPKFKDFPKEFGGSGAMLPE
jgi:ribulose-5-phosphate 4-epimerase/fuculose-1-phosphate aldolase